MNTGQKFNPYRLFVGVHIPNAILRYEKLSLGAAVCYGRLAQYAGENGLAYPSNKTLSEELGVSPRSIQTYIRELETEGFVNVVRRSLGKGDQGNTNLYEFLWHEVLADSLMVGKTTHAESAPPPMQDLHPPHAESAPKENHLRESLKEKESYSPLIAAVVNYLNEKCGTDYRTTTKKTRDLITARVREGFEFEDFKTVIDKKAAAWRDDDTMKIYLRPVTLFGTKFESYLNEKKVSTRMVTD
jgi:uncharacterized phage protein (TIGR02220 family)